MIDETGLVARIDARLKAMGLTEAGPHAALVRRYKRTALFTSCPKEADAFFDRFCAELEELSHAGRQGAA